MSETDKPDPSHEPSPDDTAVDFEYGSGAAASPANADDLYEFAEPSPTNQPPPDPAPAPEPVPEDDALPLAPGPESAGHAGGFVWEAGDEEYDDELDPGLETAVPVLSTAPRLASATARGVPVGDPPIDDDGLVGNEALLEGLDPEAHIRNTARKKAEIRRQVTSAGGQFVIGLLILMVSIALIILAATNYDDMRFVITAALLAPPGLIYALIRWRKWLGAAPYCYRLLTSLGENADDVLLEHANRRMAKVHKQMRKHQNR